MRRLLILIAYLSLFACRHPSPTSQALSAPIGIDLTSAPKGKSFTDLGEYVIDSNDVLNVTVEGKPEINGIYRVSPTGIISVPVTGPMRAKGLTEAQLRDTFVLKLRPLIKTPRVTVSVVQANSNVVYFTGKVQKPGTYRLEARMTLLQGLALAGGVRGDDVQRVIVIREAADGTKKRYETSYAKVKEGQGSLDNFLLDRGDLVLIE